MSDQPKPRSKGAPATLSAMQVETLVRGGTDASAIARLLELHSASAAADVSATAAYRGPEKAKPTATSPEEASKLESPGKTDAKASRSRETRGGRPEITPPDQ